MTHEQRMACFRRPGIYLVTSARLSAGRGTPEIIRMALDGGVRLVQLREKDVPDSELFRLACEARRITDCYKALLLVNDRVDVALAAGADGVHLGLDDLPVREARRIAPDLVIGASSHSAAEAAEAEAQGASYVNIGPLFPTRTKEWEGAFLGIDGLRGISPGLKVPFTVMGGVKKEHIPALAAAGARVVAVVTAITAAEDPCAAAADLVAAIEKAASSPDVA